MTKIFTHMRTYAPSFAALLLTLFAFTVMPAQAQMSGGMDDTGTSFGARVGVDFMSIGGDAEDAGTRIGSLVGGFANFGVANSFSIQPELLYVQKGTSDDQETGGTTVTTTQKFDYIEVPVLGKYEFPTGGFSPYLLAGPSVGFNVVSEREREGGGDSQTSDIEDANGVEFGLKFGLGAGFGVGSGEISIDARYDLGLTSVVDVDEGSFPNRGFVITAGYAF